LLIDNSKKQQQQQQKAQRNQCEEMNKQTRKRTNKKVQVQSNRISVLV
jgi:hypothetical protein